jgi:P-type E1-E2 ATPase
VLRNGNWEIIEAKNLVPGDVVQVRGGQCVPADLRVAEILSIALQVEQAALTGESVSVQKNTKTLGEDAKMLQDQKNILFSSTIISNGTAIGVVAYTGMNTAIGKVHAEVQAAKEDEEDTPLK